LGRLPLLVAALVWPEVLVVPEFELEPVPELEDAVDDPLLEPDPDPPPDAATVIVPFMNGCTLQ
jgi:hypothetical protein